MPAVHKPAYTCDAIRPTTYFHSVGFAIRAVDDVGNEGSVSNVVNVNYFIEPLNSVTGGSTDDVELILMIVFACTTAILREY